MDTIYMKERAYRIVETLRRENQREQRRLEQKLFSKAGLSANLQGELSALELQKRRIKEELNKIKKSSSSTWGLLPPRCDEPDNDEQFLFDMSNKYSKAYHDEKVQAQLHSRRLGKATSASELNLEVIQPYTPGPSSVEAFGRDLYRHSNLNKHSRQQWDHENKRREKILRKFNATFPSDNDGLCQVPNDCSEAVEETLCEKTNENLVDGTDFKLPKLPQDSSGNTNFNEDQINNGKSRHPTRSNVLNHYLELPQESLSNTVADSTKTKESVIRKDAPQVIKSLGLSPRSVLQPIKVQKNMVKNKYSKSLPLPGLTFESKDFSVKSASQNLPTSQPSTVTLVDVEEAVANRAMQQLVRKQKASSVVSSQEVRTLSPIQEDKTVMDLSVDQTKKIRVDEPTRDDEQKEKGSLNKKETKKRQHDSEVEPGDSKLKFDSYRYNHDGTVRMMHRLPDFQESLREAMKARYIRYQEKQWFEKELKISEIFKRD